MKTKSVIFVSISILATAVGSLAARQAAADGRPIAPNVSPIGVKPAAVALKVPVDLGPKKVTLFNKALGGSGLPQLQLAPPPAFIRLTPAVPSGAGGAKITKVGKSVYYAADTLTPDGAFLVDGRSTAGAILGGLFGSLPQFPESSGEIEMTYTTEADKQYIADCRFTPMNGMFPDQPRPLTFARSTTSATHSMTQDDGHYLYAFRAEQTAPIKMTITVPNATGPQFFFGCEISKLN